MPTANSGSDIANGMQADMLLLDCMIMAKSAGQHVRIVAGAPVSAFAHSHSALPWQLFPVMPALPPGGSRGAK